MAEALPLANDGFAFLLAFLVEFIDVLDSAPMGDVPRRALSEEAVQHATAGQQAHVAFVQRSHWATGHFLMFADQNSSRVLHRDWALPLYDPLVKLLGADKVRRALLAQAALQPGHRVLDIGCGTGTLATVIKQMYFSVEVVGLDPDPKALARAARKAQRANLSVRFEQGFSDGLPYPDASFDRVFSSFMFHHIPAEDRKKAVMTTAILFALFHGPANMAHWISFTATGVAYGWLRVASRSTATAALMHATYNVALFVLARY